MKARFLAGLALSCVGVASASTATKPSAPPSHIKYPRTTIDGTIGKPIAPDTPTVSGKVSSWSISPALAPGLKFSTATGEISGTPAAWDCRAIVVTAKNASGSATATLSLCVTGLHRTILELGHTSGITQLRFVNGRVLSADSSGYWALWNYAKAKIIVDGDGIPGPSFYEAQTHTPQIAAAGDMAVIPLANGLELHNFSTGALLTKLDVPGLNLGSPPGSEIIPPWWRLASDGSYIVIGSTTGLTFYSPAVDKTVSVAGNYSLAQAFAGAGKLLVALGPKGLNVIQSISPTTGKSTLSPKFNGTFDSWFADGGHFSSNLGSAYWIYSNAAAQQALLTASAGTALNGVGDWYWGAVFPDVLGFNVSRIGSTTPAYTYKTLGTNGAPIVAAIPAAIVTSGTMLGLLPAPVDVEDNQADINIVDLSGSAPVVSRSADDLSASPPTIFAVGAAGSWVAGNPDGLLSAGSSLSTRLWNYGQVSNIAGSGPTIATASNRVIISTAAGALTYNPNPAAPVLERSTFFFPGLTQLDMSANGAVLGSSDASGVIFASLPSGKTLSTFDAACFALSASGAIVGVVGANGDETVTGVKGEPLIWSGTTSINPLQSSTCPLLLSPDGTLIAQNEQAQATYGETNIWKNGVLSSAIPGLGVGWIDNDRLLVAQYKLNTVGGGFVYSGSAIYSSAGKLLHELSLLPQLSGFQPVGPNSIYSPEGNAIYSLTDGSSTWFGALPPAGVGSISGHQVVYVSGHTVVTETY